MILFGQNIMLLDFPKKITLFSLLIILNPSDFIIESFFLPITDSFPISICFLKSNLASDIDELEKTEIEEFKYYSVDEKFRFFLLPAILLIAFEMIMKLTILRSFI